MPWIPSSFSPGRHFDAKVRNGVPAPTVALKRNCILVWDASSRSAGIASASGPLLEVTTCLLADNEFLIFVRPGSPFSKFDGVVSITASASAEDMICWMLVLPSTVAGYFWTVPYFSFTFKTLFSFSPVLYSHHCALSIIDVVYYLLSLF